MEELRINEHTIDIDIQLFWCNVSYQELELAKLYIPSDYKDIPLRLVVGANINVGNKSSESVVFIEAEIELEEWKNLSDAIKAYKEKRGEKKAVAWIKCTEELKSIEAEGLISRLIEVDKKFLSVKDFLISLFDGIEESRDLMDPSNNKEPN